MADLTFNKKTGSLKGFGRTWKAVSGVPGKVPALPSGAYSVRPRSLMTGTVEVAGVGFNTKYAAPAYKDRRGFGWFLWLGKGNLGIHPDGNVPGTKGCIGVKKPDTTDLFEELKKRNNRSLGVAIVDE